ncbi:MAG: DUF192 domain-containing protein [Pseudomonadota bacterium]
MMKRTVVSALTAAFGLAASAFADPMAVTPLSIETDDATYTFTVEIADDQEEISFGLMERESMAADAGMLFDFNPPRDPQMFMKNTLIPLDMLFISSDGTIEMIARNAVPGSLRTISAGIPVAAVLEINGGRAAELGIEPLDTVIHPLFGNAPAKDTAAE